MRFRELVGAACLLSAASMGCSVDRGVWPNVPELRPKEAEVMAQDMEGPPSFPTLDIRQGKGRVAQYGRRLMMKVTVLDEAGQPAENGEMAVLWPPVNNDRLPDPYIQVMVPSGEAPEYFFTCVAGMRAGGIRELTLPRTVAPPDTATRSFRDASTGRRIELPSDRAVRLRVELLEVTKPRIVLLTTYSIPAMRNRRVVEF
jgi:hypothetical protein